MNRLDGSFNTGLDPGGSPVQGNLLAFSALYRFEGRTFGLVVWEPRCEDAQAYCRRHGLMWGGQIEGWIQ